MRATVTKKDLCKRVKKKTGIPANRIQAIVDEFIYELNHAIIDGDKVEIRYWGIFKVVTLKSKPVRDPRTGAAPFLMKPQKKVKFKQSVAMKRILNNKEDR